MGLAIYYWYESQTTRRRQWFMLKHFNPNWYFDILWPMLHKILQSILFLYSFAKAVFLIGSILSVSFWQLWEFLNNWWRPWVTEFLGMGAWTKKAWFVLSAPSRQQGSKMAKYYRGPQRVLQKSLFFGTHRGEGQKKYKDGRQNPPILWWNCSENVRKIVLHYNQATTPARTLGFARTRNYSQEIFYRVDSHRGSKRWLSVDCV